jgi:hypothetical protein
MPSWLTEHVHTQGMLVANASVRALEEALTPRRAARQGIADIKIKVYSFSSCQYGRAEVRVLNSILAAANLPSAGNTP